ncbi:beta-galactosidase [Nakamurella sp. UYEF19]|uniref:beta-galactosidase n=1 Tax=Nakamurella sp. UYEF19 TaxID=1756392 RepID=UPI003397A8DF
MSQEPDTSGPSGITTDRFLFGGDYNPEQWPETLWQQDIELMRVAGVNAVTVGVFSWALLEREEGIYTFDWLDRILGMLHAAGIGVILATPTASPPPWFTLTHPDALPIRADGTQLWHGSRDAYCPSAPAYRAASSAIATALAERYGSHPAVTSWHVHNEYGTFCFCDHVAESFRRWLRRKYEDLADLNRAWYTAFWSQNYTQWDQILPPRATQYLHNPTHAVDFRRFMSDEFLQCWREQRTAIRSAGANQPITTNYMLPPWNHLEQWSWSAELDFVSMDHYLDSEGPDGETHAAYAGDLSRSWALGRPWLLMEQAAGVVTLHGNRYASKGPGRMLRNSLSYIARGSQGALFFQWRAPAAGAEVWHAGLVPHAGADSRVFKEVTALGAALAQIAEVADPAVQGPVVDADVAILWHADGWWALENRSLPSEHLDYSSAVRATHRALWQQGFAVDFVRPGADLTAYRVVLVPSMFSLDDAAVAALRAQVGTGGTLVVWYFSGVADQDLHVTPGGYPGRIRDLLGVRVDEFLPLDPAHTVELSDGLIGDQWSENVQLTTATAVTSYLQGELAGRPAITRNDYGNGAAYYVSTRLDLPSLKAFLSTVTAQAGVCPVLGSAPPAGVEVIRRNGVDHHYLFVLNHGSEPVRLSGPGTDLLTETSTAAGGLLINAGGVAVVREDVGATEWSLAVD